MLQNTPDPEADAHYLEIPFEKGKNVEDMMELEEFDEEFDKMFLSNNGLGPQENHEFKTKSNKTRRTFVVSATLGRAFFTSRMMTKKVKSDLKKILKENPETVPNMKLNEIMKHISFKNKTKVIDLTQDMILPETLEMLKVDCLREDKMLYLYYFATLYRDQTMIIFTNSISSSSRIKSLFSLANLRCTCLHSHIQQKARIKKLDMFREGKYNILICTDVGSRGLDIPGVEVVINIHLPKDIDTLVHRSGRTARMGKSGKSILIADSDDRKRLTKYKKDFGFDKIKNIQVPLSNLDPLRPDIEKLKSVEKAEFRNNLEGRDLKWKKKTAEEIGLELSDQEEEEAKEQTQKKRVEIQKRKEHVKENIFTKENKTTTQKRRNVFLSTTDMKSLAEQLEELKRSKSESVRIQSKTSFEKQTATPRSKSKSLGRPSGKKGSREGEDTSKYHSMSPFDIGKMASQSQHLNKRKPVKGTSTQKKYGRKRK